MYFRRESHQGSIEGVGGGGGEGEDGKLTEVGYVGVDLLQAVNQPRQVHLRFIIKQFYHKTLNFFLMPLFSALERLL